MSGVDKLFDAIGELPLELVEETADYSPKKPLSLPKIKPWVAIAAVIVLVTGLGLFRLISFVNGCQIGTGFGASGDAGVSGCVYHSYAGPVFPLLSQEDASEVTVERNVNMDFLDYEKSDLRPHRVSVTDSYTLTNTGSEDRTLSLLYPYVGSLSEAENGKPEITVDEQHVDTSLSIGGRLSQLRGTDFTSWEDFRDLLADGSYLENVLQSAQAALDQPVYVYRLKDFAYPQDMEEWELSSCSFEISATLHQAQQGILTYGINGGSRADDLHRKFQCNPWGGNGAVYLISIDGPVEDVSIQGYGSYSCEPGTELEDLTANLEEYESTLSGMLETLRVFGLGGDISPSMLLSQLAQEDFAEFSRKDTGMLEEEISRITGFKRLLYRKLTITIPAGGSVLVKAYLSKQGSYNYQNDMPSEAEGYDLVTTLGSNLNFLAQTASLTNTDSIEIVEQNFGFDLKSGVTTVSLDLSEPEYYLNVKKKE